MLIRYRKSYEKIAMGLLSFMPDDKDVKSLLNRVKEYDTNPNWHLFLWKEDDDIVGTIGLTIEDELNVVIQHISVNPSYRNMGIGKKMVDAVEKMFGEKYDVCAGDLTEGFFAKYLTDQAIEPTEE